MLASWKESYDKPRKCIKKVTLPTKVLWELDHEEGWALKNWSFWMVVLEKTLQSPLDSKMIKPVNLGRTDAEDEAPILWPPGVNSQLIGKDPDVGKDWRQKDKAAAEDEMVRWHHQFNKHEIGWIPRDGEGQGGLACCSPWGCSVGCNLATEQPSHCNNQEMILKIYLWIAKIYLLQSCHHRLNNNVSYSASFLYLKKSCQVRYLISRIFNLPQS